MRLATAYVEITAKDSAFKTAMRQSKTSLTKFTSSGKALLGGVTKALGVMTVAAGAASAAFSVLAVQTTRSFARFEQSMAKVSTLIRKDWQKTTAVLSDGVRQLSLEIPQSAAELSNALYDIVSAGAPARRAIEVLGITGKAAVAGVSDVTTASNLLMGTINGMGLELESLTEVSDLAFSTVEQGVITFTELSGSVGRAMSGANKLGASVQELYGSMAFLTKNNLSAEMSATALGATFDELAAKSKDLAGLGVRVFGEEGKFRGIVAIIEDISKQLDGLSQQAKTNVLEEMGFERQAARAIIAMTTNLEDFRTTMSDVADSAGATEAAYTKMKDTLTNQWSLLKNSSRNLATVIGSNFAGAASSGIEKFKKMVDSISEMVEGAGGLIPLWQNHKDAVIGIFNAMAVGAIQVTAKLLTGLVDLIAAAAPLIWTPIWYNLKNVNMRVAVEFQKMGQKAMEHYGLITELSKDMKLAALDAGFLEFIKDEEIARTKKMKELTSDLVATFGEVGTGTWDVLKESIGSISAALIEATKQVGELKKAAIEPTAAAPGIAPPSTDILDPEGIKVGLEKLMLGMQIIWANYFAKLRRLREEKEQAAIEAQKKNIASYEAWQTQWAIKNAIMRTANAVKLNQDGIDKRKADHQAYLDWLKERSAKTYEEMRDLAINLGKGITNALKEGIEERDRVEEEAAQRLTERWDNVAETIRGSLEGLFTDALSGQLSTWEDFFKSIRSIASRELAKLAATRVSGFIRNLLPGAKGTGGVAELDMAATKLTLATSALIPASASLAAAAGSLVLASGLLAGTGVVGGGGGVGGGGTADVSNALVNLEESTRRREEENGESAPARQIRKTPQVGMSTNHFHTIIQITEFDLDTMSQAKVNAWMNSKGYNALKDMASKGKINPSMV